MIFVILEGENGIRIRVNVFFDGGFGLFYFKEEIVDILGLDVECKLFCVVVFGVMLIMIDSKIVIVCLESMDGSVKKCVFLWIIFKICEMIVVDWLFNVRKLDYFCDLEIRKLVEYGEVDVLIGSDYYEEFFLLFEYCIGKLGEFVGVKILFGWIIVGYVLEIVNVCSIVNCVYIFYIIFILEMRVDELMWKMWDEEVVGIIN